MNKIYVYRRTDEGECSGVAYAEDGDVLATHYSSNMSFFRGDMGLNPDAAMGKVKHELYRRKYPGGYELVEVIGREAMQHHIDAGHVENLYFDAEEQQTP